MGRVYKALDTKIGEKVALKLLRPEIAADLRTFERFANEIKPRPQDHPPQHLPDVHLGGEHETHYIAMEYISGENLKSLIRRPAASTRRRRSPSAGRSPKGWPEAHRLGSSIATSSPTT